MKPDPATTMDQEGAVFLTALLDARPRPKGWAEMGGCYNTFRNIHAHLTLIVTACREADGRLWVHVSMAGRDRVPTWPELVAVRDWLLGPEALAIQVIPPAAEHVNIHPHCLHLWHCVDGSPLPDFRKNGQV
jgi:hypothetical protein